MTTKGETTINNADKNLNLPPGRLLFSADFYSKSSIYSCLFILCFITFFSTIFGQYYDFLGINYSYLCVFHWAITIILCVAFDIFYKKNTKNTIAYVIVFIGMVESIFMLCQNLFMICVFIYHKFLNSKSLLG